MNSEKSNSPLRNKSYQFAIKIVKLTQTLVSTQREYILSKQVLKSGTAICALSKESKFAASKADFINKNIKTMNNQKRKISYPKALIEAFQPQYSISLIQVYSLFTLLFTFKPTFNFSLFTYDKNITKRH